MSEASVSGRVGALVEELMECSDSDLDEHVRALELAERLSFREFRTCVHAS
jgi:hypothetical protein